MSLRAVKWFLWFCRALEYKIMQKWFLTVLMHVISVASPEILKSVRVKIAELAEEAKRTENPWDDVLAGIMQMLVGKPPEV